MQCPLIDYVAVEKMDAPIRDATAKARIVAGGKRYTLGGSFFEPAVLVDVVPGMAAAREETFAPLVLLFRLRDELEAVRMANDTEFGIACCFSKRDLGRTFRVSEALDHDMPGVNGGITTEVAPFGSVRESGIGARARIRASRTT